MNPKSIEEVPRWVIVNALKCPVNAQISIVAKLLQHFSRDQRKKAFSMSGVVGADCEHSNIKNECEFPYGHRKICQDCGKDFTI
jgi:hypothetical protein